MGKVFGTILGLAASIVAVLLLFVLVQYLRAIAAEPDYAARDVVPALAGDVRILRDENGVPHIFGDSDLDVYRGLGYAHARDRLWQMDLQRRATQGRIAELLGAPALDGDKRARALGFPDNVRRSWAAMPPEAKAVIMAYSDGVNAYLASEHFVLPAEYRLILAEPEAWQPTDSLFVFKNLWLTLSNNAFTEAQRMVLTAERGAEFAAAYAAPAYPADGDIALDWADVAAATGLEARQTPADDVEARPLIETERGGSNNWVLGPSMTRTGSALLANDPHLALTMPSIWYLAHLELKAGPLVGLTMPGTPTFKMGRTGGIAWGLTNNPNDVWDLVIETVDPANAENYLTPEGSAPFETREECFTVRFGDEECITMRRTAHGPVVPAALMSKDLNFDEDKRVIVSMWTAEREPDLSLAALLKLNSAQDADAATDGIDDISGPIQNVVYADTAGQIGYISPGYIPVRPRDHPTGGRSAADGRNPAVRWTGYIPPQHQPQVRNPASGYVVTANARIMPDEYPYYLGDSFAPDSRQRRIRDLVTARRDHDMASMAAIQMDLGSPAAVRLLPVLLTARPENADSRAALALLKGWNGSWTDGPAPLIYETWLWELTKDLFADEFENADKRLTRADPNRLLPALTDPEGVLCDDRGTRARESCARQLSSSLTATAATLKAAYGPAENWRWSDAFSEDHPHLGLGAVPLIGDWLSRSPKRAAGPDAPNVAHPKALGAGKFGGNGGAASMRMIVDLGDLERTRFVTSSGQSGFFGSPHYDDLQKLWATGGYIEIPTVPERLKGAQETRLSPG